MHFVLFYHSLVSDWNHGNAHFLRGIVRELQVHGHSVSVFEPAAGWSLTNLRKGHGDGPLKAFHSIYPQLRSTFYDLETFDLQAALDRADIVIVHEWNDPRLIKRIGECRRDGGGFRLLFHDTHHRAASAPAEINAFDLRYYDGALVFGEVLREIYAANSWVQRAWTWHEAADVRLFTPDGRRAMPRFDLVWVGNWGDGERATELNQYLIEPVAALHLRARIHGVRYPASALAALRWTDIEYAGWAPNFSVPRIFADAAMTVHIPRRFYSESLPGIPTIRMFEALACGIPLASAPWDDCEQLFSPGEDFLLARTPQEMREHLRLLHCDVAVAQTIADHGLSTIRARHTCAHRVAELLEICASIGAAPAWPEQRIA